MAIIALITTQFLELLSICFPNRIRQRRWWQPTPVLLPGKSHGPRSLVGCRPWGRKESDATEQLPCHFSLSCTGEGNGNPLPCSCLENPRDGGAWWAAVYGVAQSQTQLKWLSSSSSNRIRRKKERKEETEFPNNDTLKKSYGFQLARGNSSLCLLHPWAKGGPQATKHYLHIIFLAILVSRSDTIKYCD